VFGISNVNFIEAFIVKTPVFKHAERHNHMLVRIFVHLPVFTMKLTLLDEWIT